MTRDTTQNNEQILIQRPEEDIDIYAYLLNDEERGADYSIRVRTSFGMGAESLMLTQGQMEALIDGLQEISDAQDT